jgi:hypothetical protein
MNTYGLTDKLYQGNTDTDSILIYIVYSPMNKYLDGFSHLYIINY